MARIPISILTGFLGSGKTTVLAHLLTHPQMRRTAVLVNEFGEVGIDDLVLRQVTDNVVLLESGCICCTIGDDLTKRLLELLAQREAGTIPPFDRAIIETTGLADPAPLMQSFMTDPLARAPFRLAAVITTVDAVNGARELDEHVESVKQVAVADRLLITKSDMVDSRAVETLLVRLGAINPSAPVHTIAHGRVDPDEIIDAGLWNARTQRVDVERWLGDAPPGGRTYRLRTPASGRHDARIETFCLKWKAPLDYQAFADAIERLVAHHGAGLLRIKGILNVEGAARPVVVHGVQHVFHPPVHLAQWPGDDRRSRVVFITKDVTREAVEAELAALSVAPSPA